jgi:hypothetical protein
MPFRHNKYIPGKYIPEHAKWARKMAQQGYTEKLISGLLGTSERSTKDVLAGKTFKGEMEEIVPQGWYSE